MIHTMIQKMSRREQIMVLLLVLGGVGIFILEFVVSPVMEKKQVLSRQLESKEQALSEMMALKKEYEKLAKQQGVAEKKDSRDQNFTLFAFLDQLSGVVNIKNHLVYMKPSTSVDKDANIEYSQVEMKLKNLKTSQLISFLYRVETSKNRVRVKRLGISKDAKKKRITATLYLETVKG